MSAARIAGLAPCSCSDHALVRLEPLDAAPETSVKVEVSLAQAILAELNGIPGACSPLIDLFTVTVRSFGYEVSELMVDADASPPAARVRLDGVHDRVLVVPAGVGLLLASRARCGVTVVATSTETDDEHSAASPGFEAPGTIETFIASLDLSDFAQ